MAVSHTTAATPHAAGATVGATPEIAPPPSGRRPPSRADTLLGQGLGLFSVGLGLAELLAPRQVARLVGVAERPLLVRALGLRELVSGAAILLGGQRPAVGLWSRVAGDALDLTLLGFAFGERGADRRRVAAAYTAVSGVTALDALAASRLTRWGAGVDRFRVVKSIAINRSPQECYEAWRRFEELPRFMRQLESVTVLDARRSRWVARGPAGSTVRWEAELVEDEPGRLLAWRSLDGGDVATSGRVELSPRPSERGTFLRVTLDYAPPAGAAGAAVAKLLVEAPEQQLQEDLRRFKQLLEAGEVITTEGQPAGRRDLVHRALAKLFTGGVS